MKIYDFNGKKNICGSRVRQARKQKNMTQEDLAAKLLVERNSVCKLEIGERFVTDYELTVLAKILDVSMEWLTNSIQ